MTSKNNVRGRRVRVALRPQYSSIHARTYAGREGICYAEMQDKQDRLVAILFGVNSQDKIGMAWVDHRDLVEVQR